MKQFKNILVTVDSRFEVQPALEWALKLAEHNRAKLKIVDVLPDSPWIAKIVGDGGEEARQALATQKREGLQALAKAAGDAGIEATAKLLNGKTSFAVMHEVLRFGHDLVVRVTKGAHSGRLGFFGTTSLRLLRKCPCALWLVRPDVPPRFERVLAAIDPAPEDVGREALNDTIMDLGQSVADYEQGQLQIVHAWEIFGGQLLESRCDPSEFAEAKQDAETRVAAVVDRFLASYDLNHDSENVHLLADEQGPGHAIAQLAKRERIDLVVMGTIARTGLAGALMGNTAEQVLDRIESAVLAVKPDGFISPVTLPD